MQMVRKWILLGLVVSESGFGVNVRLKDLVNIKGSRNNNLVGLGIVIGLPATGDSNKSIATNKAIANMISRLGIQVDEKSVISTSVAAVVATAELPPFSKNGDQLDVKISVVGDATSLQGGTLIQTPLKGQDGRIYAVAQGSIAMGEVSGVGGQTLTSAMLPRSAIVEREFVPNILFDGSLILSLKKPDYTNNSRISEEINSHFKGFYAESVDFASIKVDIPPLFKSRLIEFISELEGLSIEPDRKAVVVINESTGTIVMGQDVSISKVAISHGDLTIQVGDGEKKTTEALVQVGGTTVGNLVQSLNAMGIKPSDLIAIFKSIHAAGALQAELKTL